MFEIIIHGRAGQGSKSMGQFLAEAALIKNKYFHAFPTYGPEKTGSPMAAYVKISDGPIPSYGPIVEPDAVVVIDETLLESIPVAKGLKKNGSLIVNTNKGKDYVKMLTKFTGKIYTVDATGISLRCMGTNTPNTPMLGALVKITGVVDMDSIDQRVKVKFLKKIGEAKTQQNIDAIKAGYDEVK
ncbi:MAG: 2-oxoacid:acceptor oxidoreductase family protein [Candidatus Woesearchaeota archaeon]